MEDRLRPLWDVMDLDATEERLRAALDTETMDPGRAEVLSQLSRLAWMRGLDAARSLLDEAEGLAGHDASDELAAAHADVGRPADA